MSQTLENTDFDQFIERLEEIRNWQAYNFRTALNYQPEQVLHSPGPSMTEPDQSLTVREILLRYAQGRPLSISNNLTYTGAEFAPDIRKYDLVEIAELREITAQKIKALEKDLNEQALAQQTLIQNQYKQQQQPQPQPTAPTQTTQPWEAGQQGATAGSDAAPGSPRL